jgi:hypothetical protein
MCWAIPPMKEFLPLNVSAYSWAVHILEAYHDFLAGIPFKQEEFDDGSLSAFDFHCHFSVLAV